MNEGYIPPKWKRNKRQRRVEARQAEIKRQNKLAQRPVKEWAAPGGAERAGGGP